ncbi:hypothetical protein TanjilG_10763 [Lupinus angustifolius]|uniref:Uncharacterized protein n=1 Tax=Lupinus angustifolius TaxID=3871 RepID=A0A1J7IRF0_LUPAN|nr:PREDICTED: uncharacterized protein LOC109342582 [Lupinus angustifolius]OIW15323.1 hypothetical protein TanjilG_10763 [Lupinus angustifolius]
MATKRKRTARSNVKSTKKTIQKTTPPPSPESESPRAIVCLKNIDDMKRFEDTEDCFILGFDPDEVVAKSKISLDKSYPLSDDVSIICEKGQVACRDFPHSRHQCSKFPFKTTPHVKHCEMCYCYVCDTAAPCRYWTLAMHCNAENVGCWNDQRKNLKKRFPVAAAAPYLPKI